MAMNDKTSHSFRRLLETADRRYEEYVLSDERYLGMVQFLDQCLQPERHGCALDIGCGAGVISRGLAGKFEKVIGIDGNADNVTLARSLTDDQKLRNVFFEHGMATMLPVEDQSVDLALLNGVFEWVGLNDKGEDPQARQVQVLHEVLRVLKPKGILYLAIENRWHPRTLLRDPHTHLPWVNAVPRALANVISRAKTGRPFQAYIYGHRKLAALLASAGFGRVDKFVPFPGYQYPVCYVPIRGRQESLDSIDRIDIKKVQKVCEDADRPMNAAAAVVRMRRRTKRGLLGLMAHDLALVAEKP